MLQQPTSEESVPTPTTKAKAKEPGLSTITVDDKRKKVAPPVKTYTFDEAIQGSLDYFGGDDLAARTFVTKYAMQNPAGEYLEKTPDQMHKRLSKEFARIEAKYDNPMSEEEIYGLLDKFKYIVPQGSPMSGIGNDFKIQSISNCFIAGTQVLTTTGVKPIELVSVGDQVVTHTGHVQTVRQTHTNRLDGRQLFTFKAFRTPEITVTGNHKFWSVTEEQLGWGEEPQWNSVETLRKGDWIAIPKNTEEMRTETRIDISSILDDLQFDPDSLTYNFDVQDDTVMMSSHWSQTSRAGNDFDAHRDTRAVRRVWIVDQNFARFLGLWFGDGCVFNQDKASARVRGITFTFGAHEKDLIGFVSEYGESLLGIPPDINEHNADNDGTIQVAFHSGLVGRVFDHFWGRGYASKRFHPSMYEWDAGRFNALVTGLVESDGTVTATGDVRVVMGNEALIDSFYHMARSFGIPLGRSSSTVHYNGEARTYARLDFPKYTAFLDHVHKTYGDDRIERARAKAESTVKLKNIGDITFVRLDKKTKCYDEHTQVYTFGVEEDHSYSVQGLVAQNCFVIESPADSYGGILMADQEQVQIMKRRGGVGADLSTIRPKGLPTANAAQTTDGIEIFMDRFSNSCREVAQGGRRGALMLSLDVHHPQVLDFVKIKRDLTRVTGANISLRLSDEFMEAVEKGKQVQLRWPVEPGVKHVVEEWVDANELWTEIIASAHHCAEPGLLFWGNAKKYSPADIYEEEGFGSTSTNPCGEIILSPNDSCRLMVVNLGGFVNNPFTDEAAFDWVKYDDVVQKGQRLMDDMIDLEIEQIDKILTKIEGDPESEHIKATELNLWRKIRDAAVNGRRTGLGVTAVGDAVAQMNLVYGSDDSIEFVEQMYRALAVGSYKASVTMAKERGCFPVYSFKKEQSHPFLKRIWEAGGKELQDQYEQHGRRNIANTTTAPCGSVSILTQTTSGIEPAYTLVYTRRKKINPNDVGARVDFTDDMGDTWSEFTVRHHGFVQWQEIHGKTDDDAEDSPYFGGTSNDIDWVQKIKMQGAAQKWICHAISNTCNLPSNTTSDTVKDVYMAGYKAGCKGVTVYVDGSRAGVLVQTKFHQHSAPKRPEKLPCEVHRSRIKIGNTHEDWLLFVGLLEGKPFEIFGGTTENIELPKKVESGYIVKRSFASGGKYDFVYGDKDDPTKIKNIIRQFDNPDRGWATRMISLALRHGSPIQYIVEQLQRDKESDMYDFAKVIARVLKKFIADGAKPSGDPVCPECGEEDNLRYEGGCVMCHSCGAGKCP